LAFYHQVEQEEEEYTSGKYTGEKTKKVLISHKKN
jgi:hypothetical protein